MSKFVCNVQKFKGGQLYGMDIHIQRKTENHSNKDIDVSRSNLNYELVNGFQNEHYFSAVNKRIENGYLGQKALRKDATLACGVLISSDKQFFEKLTAEQERQFFQTAYEHLCETYGKENIISAKVHKDETTPHLHAIVVPLTKDGRLTAKELFDRKALTALHNDIPKKLKERGFNIERGEKNANVKRMETDEFKHLREQNKISVSINPNDVEPKKDGLFKKEQPEEIAQRLTQQYIKPLTEEISNLRTEIAVKNLNDERISFSKKFAKSSEEQFANLYYKVKEFGTEHVKNALEKITSIIEKMNSEKQQQIEVEKVAKEQQREQQQRNNLINSYGGAKGLYQLLDCDTAPLNFEENGEKSYYLILQSAENNAKKILWGNELRDLGLKTGDFVHFDEKLGVIQGKAEKTAQNRNLRHSTGGYKI